jgi:type 2 lantibiotic biosynthesis protein LanM
MEILKPELIRIVEQASSLTERLVTGFLPSDPSDFDDIVNSRIEKWSQTAAKGDLEKFQKRLAWDGLTLSNVRRVLGPVRLSDTQNLPNWLETFRVGIEAAASISVETPELGEAHSCLDSQNPIPFEEVFLPFLQVARNKLIAQTGDGYYCLTAEAHADLDRSLLGSLSGLCSHAIELKFSAFRARRQSALSRLLRQLQNSYCTTHYRAFIKEMLQEGGLLAFFQEYPVLARLVATVTDFWVDATGEFIQRLAADLSDIQQTFQPDTEFGQVDRINPSMSDPHNQRRSVIGVGFASGLKLIYKPKDLGLDVAYFKLLDWCDQHFIETGSFASLQPFKLLKVLNRSTYGWVEVVEYLPCQNQEEIKRYYQRAGQLLCLLYVLGANDCHNENLIACGEYPVLVDLETLMHHPFREIAGQKRKEGAEALSLAHRQLMDSVMRTGLLPRWDVGPDRRTAYDLSGLGGVGEQETSYRVPKWENINTDGMALGYETAKMSSQANAPSLEGVTPSPNEYVNELVDGFEQMYRFLVAHREALLATDGPLAALAHQRLRCVFRPTQVYASVLQKSLHPQYLRDGVDRSIELEVLSRPFLSTDSKHPWWGILKAELKALEQLDIPYFAANSDSDALLVTKSETIEQCFTESSYNRMIAQFQRLNDDDLAQQVTIIRSSLYSMVAGEPGTAASDVKMPATSLLDDGVSPISQEELVQQAMQIAKDLQRRAIRAADGSATWIGLGFLPQANRFQLQPIEYGLYDGCCGVALFLAALTKITGDNEWRDLCLGTLQPLRQILQDSDPESRQKLAKQIGIGGATGLGSIVYSLVRISQFLDDRNLLEDAKQAASLITPDSMAADKNFDILSGAAGAILGLLALHQVTADSAILAQVIKCAHHLLSQRVVSETGFKTWASLGEKPLTGFSHGAAGIAYALLRSHEVTQEAVFREAAEEAIAYERSVFSPAEGNWPDLRSFALIDGKPTYMVSWCHGAPGIGLARLGSLAILDTPEIREEIAVALNTTLQFGLQNIDHPCCGNCGRMEVVLVAAQKLLRPDLVETVQTQASGLVARANKVGTFHLFPQLPKDVYNPGFFQGTAGIGYELLRLTYPNLLPSVLLWE